MCKILLDLFQICCTLLNEVKKTDHQRIDAFKLWCWRSLLRGPLTSRSTQLILREINPEYSLLKLKIQYFGHLMWTAGSLGKTLMLGKIEGKRRRRWQSRWLDSITNSIAMNLRKRPEVAEDRGPWCAADHGVAENWTWLRDWTTTTKASTGCIVPSCKSRSQTVWPWICLLAQSWQGDLDTWRTF